MLNGKRILVTGGNGFLGKHVVKKLEKYSPTAIYAPRSKKYDLRELKQIKRCLENYEPEIVIHLAAVVGGIEANKQNPAKFFYDNAIMGLQLMEECQKAQIEKFISTASICSYPKITQIPFKESSLWDGYPEETNAPYGLAKKMLLVQAQAYRIQYNFNAVTLFPVNLYGPYDNFDLTTSHVIPALIRKMVNANFSGSDKVEIWGTGNATREFLYVEDAAEAICLAADKYNKSDPMNIGNGNEISIRKLAEKIALHCGFSGRLVFNDNKPDGQPRRCLDVSFAAKEIGFVAKTDLDSGLEKTIKYYLGKVG